MFRMLALTPRPLSLDCGFAPGFVLVQPLRGADVGKFTRLPSTATKSQSRERGRGVRA